MTDGPGKLGFVGLGAMGAPIVEALIEAGNDVVVHDQAPGAVERAVALGAGSAPSARPSPTRPRSCSSACRRRMSSAPSRAARTD